MPCAPDCGLEVLPLVICGWSGPPVHRAGRTVRVMCAFSPHGVVHPEPPRCPRVDLLDFVTSDLSHPVICETGEV